MLPSRKRFIDALGIKDLPSKGTQLKRTSIGHMDPATKGATNSISSRTPGCCSSLIWTRRDVSSSSAIYCDARTGIAINSNRSFFTHSGSSPNVSLPPNESSQSVVKQTSSCDDISIIKKHGKEGRRRPSSGLPLIRHWYALSAKSQNNSKRVSCTQNDASPKIRFSICSYNTLCQETLFTTPYLYTNCPDLWLDWTFRWNLIIKDITKIDADIYCLQEVNEKLSDSHFGPFFNNLGFEGVFKKRTGNKPDGCAIFWRRSKFLIESADFVEYQIPNTFLDRDNVGVIVRLIPLLENGLVDAEKRLVVANTHLLFNPGRGDIKLCQLALFLARIRKCAAMNRIADRKDYYPTVICGDFNATPFSPLYNFLIKGELYYHGMRRSDVTGQKKRGGPQMFAPVLPARSGVNENCESFGEENASSRVMNVSSQTSVTGFMRHDLNLRSVYDHKTKQGTNEVSTYHCREATNVDYIFYTDGEPNHKNAGDDSGVNPRNSESIISSCKLICTEHYGLPDKLQLDLTSGTLPNRTCGSDHLPLAAKFEY